VRRKKPKRGDKVILIALPPGFLDDLARDEQRAISRRAGKPIRLHGYDEDGRTELEFKAEERNTSHVIWAKPKYINPAK
jgi:hypothetical protein